jgi:propionate CoA-transferase
MVGRLHQYLHTAEIWCLWARLLLRDLDVRAEEVKLTILREGAVKKMVGRSSTRASTAGSWQSLAFVWFTSPSARLFTRLFKLRDGNLTVVELAPGIDVHCHVLDQSDTEISVADDLRLMDKRIFFDRPMLR